jgi:hypothetical protein
MSFMNAIDVITQSSRYLLRGALLVALCALLVGPAKVARAAVEMDLDALTPVSDDKLAEMRGGFRFNGTDITFGVVIETVVNGGAAILRTAFNADSAGGPIVTLNGNPAAPGDAIGAFQLKQAADGGFLLTNNQGTKILHQLGNAGGGIVAAISNSLNGQLLQQQAQVNITNLNTIRGLSVIGSMLNQLGLAVSGQAPGF